MLNPSKDIFESIFAEREEIGPVEWCEQNVDFALNYAYPTEYRGKWDPDFLPFWNEPLENCFDPNIREQAIWKPAQAGGTENVALNAIRYAAAMSPRRVLYVWGDQAAAEADFRERVVGGLKCCSEIADKVAKARTVECRMDMCDMAIQATWPKNKMAFKRNPWSFIIADEFSTYPSLTPGMIRKRCVTVPFSHILWISSMDATMKHPSEKDPIYLEYKRGDQRKWHCKDPVTGNPFVFVMGERGSGSGLKWDSGAKREDGTWDFEKVMASAHYVTPDGTVIRNEDRMKIVRGGKWIATNPDAPSWYRSYQINAFCMPFKGSDFGAMAVSFIEANNAGPEALKVFIYENLAETYYHEKQTVEAGLITERQAEYGKGQIFTEMIEEYEMPEGHEWATIMTVDVQKNYFYWLVRHWVQGGVSGLIDWGTCIEARELEDIVPALNVSYIGMDINYQFRQNEVLQWIGSMNATEGTDFAVGLTGNEKLKYALNPHRLDPYSGMKGQGEYSVPAVTWQVDLYRSLYMQLIRGEGKETWMVYRDIEPEYCKQATAIEKVDGEWKNRRGHTQDHIFDCEVMQVVMANITGHYHNFMIDYTNQRGEETDENEGGDE